MAFPKYTEQCPEGVYEKTIKIADEQVGENGCMQLGDLARQMQSITEDHLRTYGITAENLKEEGKIWVIGWNAIEILRLPKCGENVHIRIWPCKKKSSMYTRKYAFYAENGEPLLSAASFFPLMDSETRTLTNGTAEMENIPVVTLDDEPAFPKLLMPFPKELDRQVERIVQPEEIDLNGHLNNAHYLDWTEDLLKVVCGKDFAPKRVWIQYGNELLEGEKVTVKYACAEQTMYLKGYAGEKESFAVTVVAATTNFIM